MDGVQVMAFVVRCVGDLLLCHTVDVQLDFRDIEDCRSRLPAIIRVVGKSTRKGEVVLGKCRFVLKPPPAPVRHPPAGS